MNPEKYVQQFEIPSLKPCTQQELMLKTSEMSIEKMKLNILATHFIIMNTSYLVMELT